MRTGLLCSGIIGFWSRRSTAKFDICPRRDRQPDSACWSPAVHAHCCHLQNRLAFRDEILNQRHNLRKVNMRTLAGVVRGAQDGGGGGAAV